MKILVIILISASILFGCKKNQSSSGTYPVATDSIDNLSNEILELIDKAGVDTTFTFGDALFADGSSMREWEIRNDTGYQSQFTRERDVSDKEYLFISSMIHRASELVEMEVKSQKHGLAYVWGSKSTNTITLREDAACKEKLFGLDCSGMIYQMAIGSGLEFQPTVFSTEYIANVENWNNAFNKSGDFKGLKMTAHLNLPQSEIRSGDIIVSAGHHVGMVVYDKIERKKKLYHSGGGQKKSCTENTLSYRGPVLAKSFEWFFDKKEFPTYSILRVTQDGVPGVTTRGYSSQTHTTIEFAGDVTNDGGSPITARGMVWSTHPNSTLSDNFTVEGQGKGQFYSVIPNLLSYPYYYARAYATNKNGTSYGLELKFMPLPDSVFLDERDNKTYTFRHIGNQVWMTQNLDFDVPSQDLNDPVSCVYPGTGGMFGHLYTFGAAGQAIPKGWRLPSDNDYLFLLNYVAAITGFSSRDIDEVLKSKSGWDPTLTQGNNVSGFSALAAGSRQPVKEEAATGLNRPLYGGLQFNTWWWKSNEETDETAHIIGINEQTLIATPGGPKKAFFSIRCIRNN